MRGFAAFIIAMALLFTNCIKEPVPIEGMSLDVKDVTLNIDSTLTFTPVFYPEGAYDRVEWSSTNPLVATIDEQGNLTAHQLGVTIVKANVQGFSAECMVTVVPHVYTAGNKVVMDGEKVLYNVTENTKIRVDADHNIYTASGIKGESYTLTFQINKNGQKLYTLLKSDYNSYLMAFETDGTNLYTAIDNYNANSRTNESRVYKNRQLYKSFNDPYDDISIRSICAKGNDVYCGGYIYNGRYTATVWKNKKPLYHLLNTPNYAMVNSIAVDGDDVYSLVYEYARRIYVFKNDQQIFFTNEDGQSSNLIVNNGHIYLVLGGSQHADIYVDGQKGISLETQKYQGTLSMSIYETAFCGDDMYTLGLCNYNPTIWKNGEVLYSLPRDRMELKSLAVMP